MIYWKDVPGFEGKYAASQEGKILNLKTGRILAGVVQSNGYRVVSIGHGREAKLVRVHRLIALTFLPKSEGKDQVNHINGDKLDNRALNLEWVNASENQIHALANGLSKPLKGEKAPSAKLTAAVIGVIRQEYAAGSISQRLLAERYGVDQSTISLVVRGKRWAA